MICEKCGKQYPLHEGEESFSYQNCSCGGKLKYSPASKGNFPITQDSPIKQGPEYKQHPGPTPPQSRIKWKGVFVGISFLFISLILTGIIAFGENLPTSPSDIPSELLTYFSILAIILTTLAGSISAYLSGSKKFLEGAINGGMVGVILGLILGMVGGIVVSISGIIIFGLISMAGGVIGIFPRKLFK